MADGSTPNYDFTLPEVGLSKNSWGQKLNDNWTLLDTILGTSGGGGTFVNRAGDTMTGNLILENTVSFRAKDTSGTGRNVAQIDATDTMIFGSTAIAVNHYVTSPSGRHNFYCGTGNLDAALASDGFYLFGNTGVATTGQLRVNSVINPSTLAVTGGITLGHGGTNGFLDNTEGGTFQFRWSGTTRASINSAGLISCVGLTSTGPIVSDMGGSDNIRIRNPNVTESGQQRWKQVVDGSGSLVFTPAAADWSSKTGNVTILNDASGIVDFRVFGGTGWSDTPPNANSILNRARGDGRYVRADQNTVFTGTPTISAATASLMFQETDQAANVAWWWAAVNGSSFTIAPRDNTGANLTGSGSFVITRNAAGITGANINTSSGNRMLFGAESPTGMFSFVGSDNRAIRFLTASRYMTAEDTTGTVKFYVNSTNGTIASETGTITTISDVRLKEQIEDATPQLDDVLAMHVINYHLKSGSEKYIGFLAHEMQAIKPGLVEVTSEEDDPNQYLGVKLTPLIPILVKAIQELNAKVEALSS